MNTLRGSDKEKESVTRVERSRSFAVSVVVHVVIVMALVRFLISPAAFTMIFGHHRSVEVPPERIGFLRLPKSNGPAVEGRSGGDNRPVSKTPPAKIVAPAEVPTALPPAPETTKAAEPEGGSGPLVGTGGPARGIKPTYSDPRVWVAPGDIV
ncbi:MAG TPA: hypothetical protein VF042_01825, partial [Gemmatimonadaceae bacterium]